MGIKHVLSAISISLLTACGGGSSSPESKEPVQTTPPAKQVAETIVGKVIDGYVSGATVYLDLNGNGQLDDGEPSAVTGENGEYRLDLDASEYDCKAYVPMVVDVPVGAVDSDLGEVTEAYQMVMPPLLENAFEKTDITPLTTILWDTFKDQYLVKDSDLNSPTLACDVIKDNHEKVDELKRHITQTIGMIVQHYNISEDVIFADFIANGDTATHELAMLIVKGLQKGFAESIELQKSHPNSFVDVQYLKTESGWVRKEYIYTEHGNDNSNGWSAHTKVRSSTYSVSDDLEVIGNQIDFYNRDGAGKNIGDDKVILATSEESCNRNEYLSYFEQLGDNEVHEREVTNITSSCGGNNDKFIFNMQWSDTDKRLGHIAQYIVRFDDESGEFLMFDDLSRFHQNKNQLDFAAINAEIDGLNYHYDDDITDTTELYDTFRLVIFSKYVEENGLRVEYRKIMEGFDGWSYEAKRFNADGTYTMECKAVGSDSWEGC